MSPSLLGNYSLDPLHAVEHVLTWICGRGAAGIGLETTLLLARLGATVYVCARNNHSSRSGIIFLQSEIKRYRQESYSSTGSVIFHELDLASVRTARRSAQSLRSEIEAKAGRLDILVANAGLAFATQDVLSDDGIERCFAVNCVGHFAFINELLCMFLCFASITWPTPF